MEKTPLHSKIMTLLLIITALYAVYATYLYSKTSGKADYYVCTFNNGILLQGNITAPDHWQCINATDYYANVAVCNYKGTGAIP